MSECSVRDSSRAPTRTSSSRPRSATSRSSSQSLWLSRQRGPRDDTADQAASSSSPISTLGTSPVGGSVQWGRSGDESVATLRPSSGSDRSGSGGGASNRPGSLSSSSSAGSSSAGSSSTGGSSAGGSSARMP